MAYEVPAAVAVKATQWIRNVVVRSAQSIGQPVTASPGISSGLWIYVNKANARVVIRGGYDHSQ